MFYLIPLAFVSFWVLNLSSQELSCESVFSDVNKFAKSVTQNAEFSRGHQSLFGFYIRKFFKGYIDRRSSSYTFDTAEQYPELSKPALREQNLIFGEKNTETEQKVLRVRALSLQESSFRTFLGKVSTGSYLGLELDPNFIYFTLTDSSFKSSGYIAVILGTAKSQKDKSPVNIAFVGDIQNIPQVMILPMLEAMRLSLEELGYRLGLPMDKGISTMSHVTDYVDSEVKALFNHELEDFKPHENQYNFSQDYFRAYSNPKLLEFERWEGNFKIEAGEIYEGSKIPEGFTLKSLVDNMLSLADSKKEEDQISFINQVKFLSWEEKILGLPYNFLRNYLISKIEDRQVSFKVRKKALYTMIDLLGALEIGNSEVFKLLEDNFSIEEKTEIIEEMSHWKNSDENSKWSFINTFSFSVFKSVLDGRSEEIKDFLNSPLKKILNVNSVNGFLYETVRHGNREMVGLMLDSGADVSKRGGTSYSYYDYNEHKNGETVLFPAVRNGDRSMVEFLLDKGVDISAVNVHGETALFPAVRNGDRSMVEFLLDKGVDISAVNVHGETVLDLAIVHWRVTNDLKVVDYLVDKGADIKLVKKISKQEQFYLRTRQKMLGKK